MVPPAVLGETRVSRTVCGGRRLGDECGHPVCWDAGDHGRAVSSIGEAAILTPKVVCEISGQFLVPSYQRGYRWGPDEVRRLLDDIEASRDNPYYLQPIVVTNIGDDYWELVDGPQRLASLYLILRHIRGIFPAVLINYSLEYEARPTSATYLDLLDGEAHQQNIAYFHIFEAHRTIAESAFRVGSRRRVRGEVSTNQ